MLPQPSLALRRPIAKAAGQGGGSKLVSRHSTPHMAVTLAAASAAMRPAAVSGANKPAVRGRTFATQAGRAPRRSGRAGLRLAAVAAPPEQPAAASTSGHAPTDFDYDAVIVGSGMGGLATACQMAAKGAKVVVLEK